MGASSGTAGTCLARLGIAGLDGLSASFASQRGKILTSAPPAW